MRTRVIGSSSLDIRYNRLDPPASNQYGWPHSFAPVSPSCGSKLHIEFCFIIKSFLTLSFVAPNTCLNQPYIGLVRLHLFNHTRTCEVQQYLQPHARSWAPFQYKDRLSQVWGFLYGDPYTGKMTPLICRWCTNRSNCGQYSFEAVVLPISPNTDEWPM